ncbi:hypothetical protein Vretimale_13598 [Volvox reticuliferus]|uniref:Uncharacterized protein n=1 Tax=Volvox reticuliferus TaxID=1737510 RepID=A0A8J4GM99_9CHLO|nr:hypothetical protein Vretimale_13598 [Volvox reticuliferus]
MLFIYATGISIARYFPPMHFCQREMKSDTGVMLVVTCNCDICRRYRWLITLEPPIRTGICRWVAGIPQVLLDFAKEINAKLGPMEEQRIKYGPDLYGITDLGIRLDVCLAVWAESATAALPEAHAAQLRLLDVVEPAIGFYCEQMLRVVRHIGDVFQHSPFFVNKDDLEKQHEGGDKGMGDVKEAAAAALVVKQHVNGEWFSSNVSGTSISADYGGSGDTSTPPMGTGKAAVVAPLPLLLSQAPSVTAPATPGQMIESPPRAETMLSMSSSRSGIGGLSGEGKPCVDMVAAATSTVAAVSCTSNAIGKLPSTAALSRVGPDATAIHPTMPALHVLPPPQQQQPELGQLQGLSPGRSGLRIRLSNDSHASFISALEQQPWYSPDEYVGGLKPLACQQQQQLCNQHEKHLHQKQHLQHQQSPEQYQQHPQHSRHLQHQHQDPLEENDVIMPAVEFPCAHAQQHPTPPRGCFSGCIGRWKSSNPGSSHQRQQQHNGRYLQAYEQAQQQRAPR